MFSTFSSNSVHMCRCVCIQVEAFLPGLPSTCSLHFKESYVCVVYSLYLKKSYCVSSGRKVSQYLPPASVFTSVGGRRVSDCSFHHAAGLVEACCAAAAAGEDLCGGARHCAWSGDWLSRQPANHVEGLQQTSPGRGRRPQQSEKRVRHSDWYDEANTHARTHACTHTHTRLTTLFQGQPGWAGTKSGLHWSKRQWVAVALAGPYESLHLAPGR